MINIKNKKDCCGCSACAQICPKQCIIMTEDKEGFLYPKVNLKECIDCGLCEKVCPVLNQSSPKKPLEVYAAKNKDEKIRLDSSSGGLFNLIAEFIIKQGGVVFGARFNDKWEVVHDFSETIEGLAPFRKSKYVQSVIGDSYNKVLNFLKIGRKVLFTGTPCQIAGLRLFLRKEYSNLLTLDIVCHGVPSPLVWRKYLKEKVQSLDINKSSLDAKITDINFRNKSKGWKSYNFVLTTSLGNKKVSIVQTFRQNLFMKGFLQNLYLRPICYKCPAKSFKSGSDITLGDFWGISKYLPELDDDKGISLVTINSAKGKDFYSNLDLNSVKTSYNIALEGNPSLELFEKIPKNRILFYDNNIDSIIYKIKKYTKESLYYVIRKYIIRVIIFIGMKKIARKLLRK